MNLILFVSLIISICIRQCISTASDRAIRYDDRRMSSIAKPLSISRRYRRGGAYAQLPFYAAATTSDAYRTVDQYPFGYVQHPQQVRLYPTYSFGVESSLHDGFLDYLDLMNQRKNGNAIEQVIPLRH